MGEADGAGAGQADAGQAPESLPQSAGEPGPEGRSSKSPAQIARRRQLEDCAFVWFLYLGVAALLFGSFFGTQTWYEPERRTDDALFVRGMPLDEVLLATFGLACAALLVAGALADKDWYRYRHRIGAAFLLAGVSPWLALACVQFVHHMQRGSEARQQIGIGLFIGLVIFIPTSILTIWATRYGRDRGTPR
jgi:heme/copper-type cytochrome/quinol oxidase subunit 4